MQTPPTRNCHQVLAKLPLGEEVSVRPGTVSPAAAAESGFGTAHMLLVKPWTVCKGPTMRLPNSRPAAKVSPQEPACILARISALEVAPIR